MPSLPGASHSCSQAPAEGAGPSGLVAARPHPALPHCQLLRAFPQVALRSSPPRPLLPSPCGFTLLACLLADQHFLFHFARLVVPLCVLLFSRITTILPWELRVMIVIDLRFSSLLLLICDFVAFLFQWWLSICDKIWGLIVRRM